MINDPFAGQACCVCMHIYLLRVCACSTQVAHNNWAACLQRTASRHNPLPAPSMMTDLATSE